ncbi:MAG: dihydropteroate synthase [Phycisphaerae bacterium]
MTQILGILNLTPDSFSDGGRFLDPSAAIKHALTLAASGADVIDVGAESTHPDARGVTTDQEIARLTPVVTELKRCGLTISVDTCKPQVMREMLSLGTDFINDVSGMSSRESIAAVRDSNACIIVMHAIQQPIEPGPDAGPCIYKARAGRQHGDPATIIERVQTFFTARVAALCEAGVSRERIILDPGMGLFLGENAEASLAALARLDALRFAGLPLCVSISRKSFIGTVVGAPGAPRPVAERAAGTLAAELWAAASGVEYIRTHDAAALRDGLRVWGAIRRYR